MSLVAVKSTHLYYICDSFAYTQQQFDPERIPLHDPDKRKFSS